MKKVKVKLKDCWFDCTKGKGGDQYWCDSEASWISPRFIDRIEELPDYDQWIRDKVPVIGWNGPISAMVRKFCIGILGKDRDGVCTVTFADEEYLYFENYCLYSATAWEKLRRGERPE